MISFEMGPTPPGIHHSYVTEREDGGGALGEFYFLSKSLFNLVASCCNEYDQA